VIFAQLQVKGVIRQVAHRSNNSSRKTRPPPDLLPELVLPPRLPQSPLPQWLIHYVIS